jgi:hypothetical protein
VPALKDETSAPDGGPRWFNLKRILVVAEVALSLMLLIAVGLFIRRLRTVQAIDPGYAVDELVSAPLTVNLLRYTRAQGREFYRRVVERMEQIPGVQFASVARIAVLSRGGRVTTCQVHVSAALQGCRVAPPFVRCHTRASCGAYAIRTTVPPVIAASDAGSRQNPVNGVPAAAHTSVCYGSSPLGP